MLDTKQRKKEGELGELIAAEYYVDKGFEIIEQNYRIRNGEIDIIAQKDDVISFIEVKTVNYIEHISDYITKAKLGYIKKTIEAYVRKNNINKYVRLDFVFVKNGRIYQAFENVSMDCYK